MSFVPWRRFAFWLLGALLTLAVAAALTAFWTVPLVFRLENTRALAWGETPSIGGFGLGLALLALIGLVRARGAGAGGLVIALFPWAMALVVIVDRFVLEPLGLRWLPANRVVDGAWIAFVLAAALGWSGARQAPSPPVLDTDAEPSTRFPRHEIATALAAVLLVVVMAWPDQQTLTLWPRGAAWPSLATIERGLRLTDLWTALHAGPPGRVLFVRSSVPLAYGSHGGSPGPREWYRPHTHVTALAPVFSGRAIVNGTFTHPSPIAALAYRGDAGPGPIIRLVEQLDGVSLFGRALDALDAETFNRHAERLGISVVVALDEDAPHLGFLDDNRAFARREAPEPFLLYARREAVALPRAVAPGRWTITLTADRDPWVTTRTAYYPLWHARADGVPMETRRGAHGDLEVKLDAGGTRAVELDYGAGAPEIAGVVVTVLGLVGLVVFRRRGQAA